MCAIDSRLIGLQHKQKVEGDKMGSSQIVFGSLLSFVKSIFSPPSLLVSVFPFLPLPNLHNNAIVYQTEYHTF